MIGLLFCVAVGSGFQSPQSDSPRTWFYKAGQTVISDAKPVQILGMWVHADRSDALRFDDIWLSAFNLFDDFSLPRFPKDEKGEFEKQADYTARLNGYASATLSKFFGPVDRNHFFLLPVPITSFTYDVDTGKETITFKIFGDLTIESDAFDRDDGLIRGGHSYVDLSHVPSSYHPWGNPEEHAYLGIDSHVSGCGFTDTYTLPLDIDHAKDLKHHFHLALICRFDYKQNASLVNSSIFRHWHDEDPFISVVGDVLFDERSGSVIRERLPKQ